MEDYLNIRAVGFDETSSRRGHNYITIAVDLDTSKVIFASEGKDHTTIDSFSDDFISHLGKAENITDVCSDLSKAYNKGVQDNFPNAAHTYDKFHIMVRQEAVNRIANWIRLKMPPNPFWVSLPGRA